MEDLIIKHLSGETSAREDEELKQWLNASEDNKKLFHFHQAMWEETTLKYDVADQDLAFDQISESLGLKSNRSKKVGYSITSIPIYARAASIVLLALLGLMAWYALKTNEKSMHQIAAKKVMEKEATKGQKLKTFLPDGSIAWLNAESKIRYDEFFSDSLRLVHLTGMAYFEVAKDSLRPFVVRSDNMDVTALGTAFTVRSYDTEDIASVALERGRIAVDLITPNHVLDQIILEPGRKINYNITSHSYKEVAAIPEDAYNWRDGVLHFENASFGQVIKELSRWYGVEIVVVNHPAETWHYTSTFKNFYLKEVLQSISYTKDFKYEIHPEKVIIKN